MEERDSYCNFLSLHLVKRHGEVGKSDVWRRGSREKLIFWWGSTWGVEHFSKCVPNKHYWVRTFHKLKKFWAEIYKVRAFLKVHAFLPNNWLHIIIHLINFQIRSERITSALIWCWTFHKAVTISDSYAKHLICLRHHEKRWCKHVEKHYL